MDAAIIIDSPPTAHSPTVPQYSADTVETLLFLSSFPTANENVFNAGGKDKKGGGAADERGEERSGLDKQRNAVKCASLRLSLGQGILSTGTSTRHRIFSLLQRRILVNLSAF